MHRLFAVLKTAARVAACAAITMMVALWSPDAKAQTYPSKAIRLVVPYPAGAAGDILARLFGEYASAKLGQPIIVDNRPGGAGIAATDAVAKAAPDGYTLLLTGPNHVTNVGLYASLPYDPAKDFVFISVIGTDYTILMANPKSGFSSAQDLIAKAKAKPNSINFSSSGIGTGGHLSMELFMHAAGIKLVHIPYRGATPALTDTVSGQVPLNVTAYAPAMEYLQERAAQGAGHRQPGTHRAAARHADRRGTRAQGVCRRHLVRPFGAGWHAARHRQSASQAGGRRGGDPEAAGPHGANGH